MSQIERIPPHNDDAEKSVLGALLLDRDALFDVMEFLAPEDFYNEMHQEIFRTIQELHHQNKPVDILTVADQLKKRKSLEMVGGRGYIAQLSTTVPTTANAAQYGKIVAEKAILRRLISKSFDIVDKGYQEKMEPEEILDYAEQAILEIAQTRKVRDYEPVREVLKRNIQRIDEVIASGGQFTGIPTGFKDLDTMTFGFQKSDLVILGARPSMGKTAFALNVAQNATLKEKATVLIFSLEMPREHLGLRLLAMEARVGLQKLKSGNLDPEDWSSLMIAMERLSEAPLYIDDTPGITAMEMKNKCRRLRAEKGLDMVIIDYLQLMSLGGRVESRQQEVSTISRQLKQLAREMECPVVVLSQLSRSSEKDSTKPRKPFLSDLRESGAIEQDADLVLLLHRDDYYTKEESQKPNVCEVNVAKHRNGPTGVVELTWLAQYTRFMDIAKHVPAE